MYFLTIDLGGGVEIRTNEYHVLVLVFAVESLTLLSLGRAFFNLV